MSPSQSTLLGLAAALGGGLLIGIERERRKGAGRRRALAGVRSFALAAVAGAGAQALQQPLLVAAGAALVVLLCATAYWRNRSEDPGITTEIALLLTYVLGVTAIGNPGLAAGGAVVVAILLAGRETLHHFSVDTLSETELRDGLLFAAAALILLPLLPDKGPAWSAGINPRRLWQLVVLFMALQAAGHIALRAAGARFGLALSGLAAGFVTSTGTIAALGARVRHAPSLRAACVAGALFSSVTTVLLLIIVTIAVLPRALGVLGPSFACSLLAILAVAVWSLLRQKAAAAPTRTKGHAFNLFYAVGFALILALVTAGVALASRLFGTTAAGLTAAVAGAFDVHAAAISALSLAANGTIPVSAVRLPILAAFSLNTISKFVAAFVGGGAAYGWQVSTGLLLGVIGAWAPLLFID